LGQAVFSRNDILSASRLATSTPAVAAEWSTAALAGRLAELSAAGAAATLTLAFALVLDAQQRGEPAVWITTTGSSFFPPDAAAGGVDLDALVVVRVATAPQMFRAADRLARSGGFGLLVLDLGDRAHMPAPAQTRLAGLAGVTFAVYFIHLILVWALFAYLPFSKLAHLVYRTVAMTYNEYAGRNF